MIELIEIPWLTIDRLMPEDGLIMAVVNTDPQPRIMIWDAKILLYNIKGPRPLHLQYPATHWYFLSALKLPE